MLAVLGRDWVTEAQLFTLLQISWMVPNISFIPFPKWEQPISTNWQECSKLPGTTGHLALLE